MCNQSFPSNRPCTMMCFCGAMPFEKIGPCNIEVINCDPTILKSSCGACWSSWNVTRAAWITEQSHFPESQHKYVVLQSQKSISHKSIWFACLDFAIHTYNKLHFAAVVFTICCTWEKYVYSLKNMREEQDSIFFPPTRVKIHFFSHRPSREWLYGCNRNHIKCFPIILIPITVVTGMPLNAFPLC